MFVHGDFLDYDAVEEAFAGIDACLFCLGISATQVSDEEEYRRITHDFALAAAGTLRRQSPAAAFHFISGQGTRLDSRMMWARVKAGTERDLIGLVGAVCWRPAFIDGEDSQNTVRGLPGLAPAISATQAVLRPLRDGRRHRSRDDLGNSRERAWTRDREP